MGSGLIPTVLAAEEPSKIPFYVAGGVLAGWAVLLGAIGLTRPGFPGTAAVARATMAVSAVLVLATMVATVATSAKHQGEGEAKAESKGKRPAGAEQAAQEGNQEVGVEPGAGAEPPGEPEPAAGSLKLSADPGGQLAFEQESLTAAAGAVTIELSNDSPVPHDVTIEQGGRKIAGSPVVASDSTSVSADLEPGEYTFYCSVSTHRGAGMEGKLTVSG